MLGKEEIVQQRVDLQESFTVQAHISAIHLQESAMPQRIEAANRCRMSTPNLPRKYGAPRGRASSAE